MQRTGLGAVAVFCLISVSFFEPSFANETAVLPSESRAASSTDPSQEEIAFFENHVRPVLAEPCYQCHSSRSQKLAAGLFVDSREGLLRGGDAGPGLIAGDVAGDVDASLIDEAVRYESYGTLSR